MTHDHTPGDGQCMSCDLELKYLKKIAEQAYGSDLTITFKLSSIPGTEIGGISVNVIPTPGTADKFTPDLLAELLEMAAAEARQNGMFDIETGAGL